MYWSVKEAIRYVSGLGIPLTPNTIRKYCRQFSLGYSLGGDSQGQGRRGKFVIDKVKFSTFIQGKFKKEVDNYENKINKTFKK